MESIDDLEFEVRKLSNKIEDFRFDQSYNTQIKPVTVAPRTPDIPQGRDTFKTPNYATDLLIPFIPRQLDNSKTYIWECASGEGKIANRLIYHGFDVFQSDLRQFDNLDIRCNFLTNDIRNDYYMGNFCIITNPPFSIKEEFIEKAFEYRVPFAFLINADYSGKQIDWIKRGCEKIIPNRRIDYITPTGRNGKTSSSQFHSMWLTYGFNIGQTETFVELSLKEKKENI
jgi:hypothetical protein